MKRSTCINSSIFIISIIVALPLSEAKKALAIGCDTYYRITGEIGGCTDLSTEKAYDLWLKKYSSICLEPQLAKEILIYKRKLQIYYAQKDLKGSNQYRNFTDITVGDLNIESLSLSTTAYSKNANFCEER